MKVIGAIRLLSFLLSLLSAGLYGNVIPLLMPITMTEEQLEEGFQILEEAFAVVYHKSETIFFAGR